MSDYPERISMSPTFRQKREDDFYLVDRKAFPGKGTEYVRADRIKALEALLSEAVKAGMLEGAKTCNDRGGAEQVNYGLNRGTQNYFRARDAIRALADDPETIARIVAQLKEGRG